MTKNTITAIVWIRARIIDNTAREVVQLINRAEKLFGLNSSEIDLVFLLV